MSYNRMDAHLKFPPKTMKANLTCDCVISNLAHTIFSLKYLELFLPWTTILLHTTGFFQPIYQSLSITNK